MSVQGNSGDAIHDTAVEIDAAIAVMVDISAQVSLLGLEMSGAALSDLTESSGEAPPNLQSLADMRQAAEQFTLMAGELEGQLQGLAEVANSAHHQVALFDAVTSRLESLIQGEGLAPLRAQTPPQDQEDKILSSDLGLLSSSLEQTLHELMQSLHPLLKSPEDAIPPN